MKSQPRIRPSRLSAILLAALAGLAPSAASAESTVFSTDFFTNPEPNTLQADPGEITPTYTNWFIHSGKNASASSLSGGRGLSVTYSPTSTAAGVQAIARFTQAPLSLSEVGDSITARATFYTDNVGYLSVGLYESGGVNPLISLQNAGLDAAAVTDSTGGTLGWKGYRARVQRDNTGANFAARPAQTGASLTRVAYDLVAANTNEFNSPEPRLVGSVTASDTAVTFPDFSAEEYKLSYTITRTAADELSFSYTIFDSANTVKYSTSGVTTNTDARPSAITSTFDALAIGTRNNAPGGTATISELAITTLNVTANNSQIAKIVNQPINQTWVAGTPGSISVNATGVGPLSYKWYKNDVLIETATSATYTVANPTGDNAGTYHVVVSNAYGYSVSADATVSLASASIPVLTTEPVSQTVNAGEPLTLTAQATGAPTPTYQWSKFNGSSYVAIPEATHPTYSISSTATTNAGTYRVTVTNGSGSDFADAVVTVHTAPPAITVEPTPVTVNVGQTVNLSVTATGYPAPTYQWYKNTGSGPVLIPGATGSAFTLASATTADIGSYHVVASNTINSTVNTATSASVALDVTVVLPSITTPPSNTTVSLGQPASFTVVATGSAPLSYQWYKDSGSGPQLIPDATSATYTINPTVGNSGGNYHVVVNNEGNVPATSASATLNLIVTEATSVFSTNFAADLLHPETPLITPTATSWYIQSSKTALNSNLGDDPATPEVESRPYTLTLNQGSGSAFFQTSARFASAPISLAEQGSSLRVTATFTTRNIRALGFGLYNSAGSTPVQLDYEDTAIDASLRTIYGTSSTTAVGMGTQPWVGYRGTLHNLHSGNVTHTIVTRPAQINATTNRGQELVVNGSGSISYADPAGTSVSVATKFPASDAPGSLTENTSYTLVYSINRSGADEFTYSYELYEGQDASGTLFRSASGRTTAAGTRPSEVTESFDALAIGMRNAGTTTPPTIPEFVFSSVQVEHSVPVDAIFPSVTQDPVSHTVAVGASFTLTAAATGSPTPTYQWFQGEDPIPGATSATYTVDEATVDNAGEYTFVATNVLGSDISEVATITISGGGASAYDTWASGFGLNPATTGAPTANPSGDGVANLVKFALGGDPTVAGSTALPTVAKSGANLTFTYDVENAALADFDIGAESSTDLATWTPAVHGTGGVSIITSPVDAGTTRVVVTMPASAPRLFIRLRIAAQP